MTPALPPTAPRPERSNAVTVIGVIFLSLALMWLLGVLFQGAFFAFVASMRPGGMDLSEVTKDPNVPVAVRFILTYATLFWVANLVAAAAIALCSIGLLRRRNWGRVAFLFIAAAGLIYSLGSSVASALMVPFLRSQMGNLEALEAGPLFSTVATVALALVIVKSLFLAGFFIWMLRKLTRPHIRAEFS